MYMELLHVFERHSESKREKSSIHFFTLQKPTEAGAGPGPDQKLGAPPVVQLPLWSGRGYVCHPCTSIQETNTPSNGTTRSPRAQLCSTSFELHLFCQVRLMSIKLCCEESYIFSQTLQLLYDLGNFTLFLNKLLTVKILYPTLF